MILRSDSLTAIYRQRAAASLMLLLCAGNTSVAALVVQGTVTERGTGAPLHALRHPARDSLIVRATGAGITAVRLRTRRP